MAWLPFKALRAVASVMAYGAEKYKKDNWKKVEDPDRYMSAMFRHFSDIQEGETHDPESGLLHAAHLACNAIMYLYLQLRNLPLGDRRAPPRFICSGCYTNGKHSCNGDPCKCLECIHLPFSGDGKQVNEPHGIQDSLAENVV